MSELVELVIESEDLVCGDGIESRKLAIYNMELTKNGLPALPADFCGFLEECNGVLGDGISVFGANPEAPFADILSENIKLNLEEKADLLVLGFDDFDYLVFNARDNLFQLIEKIDMELMAEYPSCQGALEHIMEL